MWFDSHTRNDRRHHPAAARYANRQSGHDHPSGGARSLVTCGFDSHPCYFKLFLRPGSSAGEQDSYKVEVAGSIPARGIGFFGVTRIPVGLGWMRKYEFRKRLRKK